MHLAWPGKMVSPLLTVTHCQLVATVYEAGDRQQQRQPPLQLAVSAQPNDGLYNEPQWHLCFRACPCSTCPSSHVVTGQVPWTKLWEPSSVKWLSRPTNRDRLHPRPFPLRLIARMANKSTRLHPTAQHRLPLRLPLPRRHQQRHPLRQRSMTATRQHLPYRLCAPSLSLNSTRGSLISFLTTAHRHH